MAKINENLNVKTSLFKMNKNIIIITIQLTELVLSMNFCKSMDSNEMTG